jgi:hypothetical protein
LAAAGALLKSPNDCSLRSNASKPDRPRGNGTKLPLEIVAQNELVPLNQVELIPPGAPVELIAKFGPPDPNSPGKILGLEPKIFLETWRQFSLNIQDDTKSYRLSYNEGDLAPFFPGMVGPHVTKKR